MLNSLILFAQDVGDDANNKVVQPDPFGSFIWLIPVLFFLFYFVVLRPQQRKQRQEQEALMTGLKKNDEVITAAGIIGVVSHIKETGDEVTLKIDDNARIRVLKSTIVRIVKKEETKDGTAPASTNSNTNIKSAT